MARTKTHIPQSGDELTAEWFSDILGGDVGTVERTVIGEGIGFIGELHRCELTWNSPRNGEPDSVVVKIPAALNRGVGEAMGAYEREIEVYANLHGRLGIPMPQHYHSALDPNPAAWLTRFVLFLLKKLPLGGVSWLTLRFIDLSAKSTRRYLLVMEDIHDARPPSQVDGGSIDDALAALEVLAQFHAHNWMSSEIEERTDQVWPLDLLPKVWRSSYARNREEFLSRFGHLVSDELMERLDDVDENMPELLGGLGAAPWTLLHGDYRLDNILYRPEGELVVLDYQLMGLGRAGWDVSYFITTALTPDHKGEEETMLRRYHDTLVATGIDDYSWESLVADVEATKLVLAHRFVASTDAIDTQIADGDESLLEIMLERVVGWMN